MSTTTDNLPTTDNLLAAASAAQVAALDLIEAARDGELRQFSNVAAGETTQALADALRFVLTTLTDLNEAEAQLLGAVEKYLEDVR